MTPTARTDWLALGALFLAGVGAAMHFAVPSSTLAAVTAEFGFGPLGAGLSVSIVAVIGLVFGGSVGVIVSQFGLRRLLLAALLLSAAVVVSLTVVPSGRAFLALRALEGVSHLIIVVAAPSLMMAVSLPRDRPMAMAVWATFFAVGYTATDLLNPVLTDAWGWRGLYFAHAAVLAGSAAVVAARCQPDRDRPPVAGLFRRIVADHIDVYRSAGPMLVALVFCCHTLMFAALLTFLRRRFGELGMAAGSIEPWMSVLALVSIGGSLGAGALLRAGAPARTLLVGGFGTVAIAGTAQLAGAPAVPLAMIASVILFVGAGCVQGGTFAMVPAVSPDPHMVALANGAVAQTGNLGAFIGSPAVALLLDRHGWPGAIAFIAICSTSGIMLTLALARRLRMPAAVRAHSRS